ncbi:DUF2332 domain-containing protein [Rhizobium alvei]|uniref:DUF2332 family protein n=1 Tax=Rhizobium alvei TaxID=1132659 RepID=A0ABT8YP33_9HYPH|nr:DUF2332 family protein [Rhizobium alvei]MDO6965384.1 DUF2332 family protein [Rhizobium alvei]
MADEQSVRQAFIQQANACSALGSPFTGALCRLFAERLDRKTPVGRTVLDWPGDPSGAADSVPLRLAGSLHALVLEGLEPALAALYPPETHWSEDGIDEALASALLAAFETHAGFICERLRSAPQTNEVRRSGALLPGFLTIAKRFPLPLRMSEIGASAGLNLHWDRYGYAFGGFSWGNPNSAVRITPEWNGPPPDVAPISIVERAGCDLNPIDPNDPDQCTRLLSYIWADQTDRLDRTRQALAIARQQAAGVDKQDALDFLRQRLGTSPENTVHVIYHSIAWQYLPEAARAEGERLIKTAGEKATEPHPLAHLAMEADGQSPGAALTLQIWPTGEKQEIGRADFHGRWVQWKGWRN